MKSYIVKKIKEHIDSLGMHYAQNYIGLQKELEKENPDKIKVEAAEFNMKNDIEQIAWLKMLLRKHSK